MTIGSLGKPRVTGVQLDELRTIERAGAAVALLLSVTGSALGFAVLWKNDFDDYTVPYLLALGLAFAILAVFGVWRSGVWQRDVSVVGVLAVICAAILAMTPEWLYGHQLNGVVHRSLFSTVALFGMSSVGTSTSLKKALGDEPSAEDNSRYALLLIPIGIAAFAYGIVLYNLASRGVEHLSWHVISTPYGQHFSGTTFVQQAGLRNNILGTFLLIGMTTVLALLPGVAAGVFMNEYPGRIASVVRFSTTMLRAVSPFVLAVAAFSLVQATSGRPPDDPISEFIRGSYRDANGFPFASKGSFLLASMILSLLVIPGIARSTEEGLRSVPTDIREGSIAIGATEGHGLRRILLPWAAPNIVTSLLIGAAEVSGSVAVLLLIAGTGEHGVGPMKEATSLSFVIFETRYGPKAFQDSMLQYRYTAALLLVGLTLTLTVVALLIKWRLSQRYRGSLTQ